jgi:hypothetical protein
MTVFTSGHAPLPSHEAASVATPLVQLAARQDAVENVQAVVTVPLHVPPQAEPSLTHAVRGATGAPVTGEHFPFVAPLHAAHWSVQVVSQHTPSTQLPDVHSLAAPHATPSACFALHAPAEQ